MKTILTGALLALMLVPASSAISFDDADVISDVALLNDDMGGKCNGYYDTNCTYYGYTSHSGWGTYSCSTWVANSCIIG